MQNAYHPKPIIRMWCHLKCLLKKTHYLNFPFLCVKEPLFLMLALLRKVPFSELVLFGSVQKALTLNTYCKCEIVMQVNRNCGRHFNIRDASPSSCARSLGKNICGNWFFVRYYQRFCWQLVTLMHSFLHNSIRFCSSKIKRRGVWRRTL